MSSSLQASPTTPAILNLLLRALHILVGLLASIQITIIATFLPAVHGTFLSYVYQAVLGPAIVLTVSLLLRLSRVLGLLLVFVALVSLTAVHLCAFPLTEFAVLATALCAALPWWRWTGFGLFIGLITPRLRLSVLQLAPPFPVSALVASLLLCAATLQSLSVRSLIDRLQPRSAPPRRRRGRGQRRSQQQQETSTTESRGVLSTVVLVVVSMIVLAATLQMQVAPAGAVKQMVRRLAPRRMPNDHVLVTQRRSATGLVSVVEKRGSHLMLLADLSVLGGLHVEPYEPNSIFPQFYVHEAVRLATRESTGEQRALCMGVGIGVVAGALRSHGVSVDAVELDATVAGYASRFFRLRGGVIVDDGSAFLKRRQGPPYDYIVHDVFSGGFINPTLLRTSELARLSDALAPDGVTVMNVVSCVPRPGKENAFLPCRWVADVAAARLRRAFGATRAFSENDYDNEDADDGDENNPLHAIRRVAIDNVVLFASPRENVLRFRKPVPADSLGSGMRAEVLDKFERFEVSHLAGNGDAALTWTQWFVEEVKLWIGMAHVGLRHAQVMRIVHPPALWSALLAAEVGMNAA